jgi:hypothetical protein
MTDSRAFDAAGRARELILFADGAEEAGLAGYARRARHVARETLWLTEQLAAERSAREAATREVARLRDLWTRRPDERVALLEEEAGRAA